jgi:hypothetical protein
MNSSIVVSHGGVTLNLATIKCFKLQTSSDLGKTNILYIEHKTRFDYIQHPKTGEYIKQDYNEKTEIEYLSWEIAEAYRNEWEEIWQDYLNEQS